MAWFWLHGTLDQACPGPLPVSPDGCAITVPRGVLTNPPQSPCFPYSSDSAHLPAHLQEGGYDAQNRYAAMNNVLFEAATFPILHEINSCAFLFALRMTQFMDLAL